MILDYEALAVRAAAGESVTDEIAAAMPSATEFFAALAIVNRRASEILAEKLPHGPEFQCERIEHTEHTEPVVRNRRFRRWVPPTRPVSERIK